MYIVFIPFRANSKEQKLGPSARAEHVHRAKTRACFGQGSKMSLQSALNQVIGRTPYRQRLRAQHGTQADQARTNNIEAMD